MYYAQALMTFAATEKAGRSDFICMQMLQVHFITQFKKAAAAKQQQTEATATECPEGPRQLSRITRMISSLDLRL